MLYICIFSNKFDLKQTIRVLHNSSKIAEGPKMVCEGQKGQKWSVRAKKTIKVRRGLPKLLYFKKRRKDGGGTKTKEEEEGGGRKTKEEEGRQKRKEVEGRRRKSQKGHWCDI